LRTEKRNKALLVFLASDLVYLSCPLSCPWQGTVKVQLDRFKRHAQFQKVVFSRVSALRWSVKSVITHVEDEFAQLENGMEKVM
jgi:hypothetical protein